MRFSEKLRMTHLDRQPQFLWPAIQESLQLCYLGWRKARRKLQKHRPQAFVQPAHPLRKDFYFFLACIQCSTVADIARNLGAEAEVRWGFLFPARHRLGRRSGIESGIAFHSGETLAVETQKVT